MATKSLVKTIRITDESAARKLADTLDRAMGVARDPLALSREHRTLSEQEVGRFFENDCISAVDSHG